MDKSGTTPILLFTIGFTGISAQEFFEKLQRAGAKRLIDVRLYNVSQLAGFTKKHDLKYFLRVIANIEYVHREDLAPTKDMLDSFKKEKQMSWADYEHRFNALLEQRKPEIYHKPDEFDRACLLCSEAAPRYCHRRLVAEHLRRRWGNVEVHHL